MRIASVNLNKRMGNETARAALLSWLQSNKVDVLIAQEPWKPVERPPISLPGFSSLGGDGNLFAWARRGLAVAESARLEGFLLQVELDWLLILGVYLDSGSQSERALQLETVRSRAATFEGRPIIVCGDFNIAPRAQDGRYGGEPSSFNSATDRAPLSRLLAQERLVDVMAGVVPDFTIERLYRGNAVEFRCDLALIPDHMTSMTRVRYEHSCRRGGGRFTDHSAILMDVPVTVPFIRTPDPEVLFELPDDLDPGTARRHHKARSEKTAMARPHESPAARAVVESVVPSLGIRSVFDHGCGRGSDVRFYRRAGLAADGWDPFEGFGWTTLPHQQYDLVTSIFVLNVLPDPWDRIRAIQHAARFARPGGHVLIVTRSPADIAPRAAHSNWPTHHDGYWSSESKNTFQKGLGPEEIVMLATRSCLTPVEAPTSWLRSGNSSSVLLVRSA